MATGPKFATTPLEVLDGPYRDPPLLSKYYGPVLFGLLGFTGTVMVHWVTRRPLFSGIQRHVGATVLGIGLGKVLEDYRNQYFADRDAVFRHYMELHPEDFPPFPREKYANVLEPWYPIR